MHTGGPRVRAVALAVTGLSVLAAACAGGSAPDEIGEPAPTTATTTPPPFRPQVFGTDRCATPGYPGNLQKVESLDAQTVKFTLCRRDVAFPAKVASPAFGIVPAEYLEETGGGGRLTEEPIGTGPYQLQGWDRGAELVLERNDSYWGDAPRSGTVVFRWEADASRRLAALVSGAADGIDDVRPQDQVAVRQNVLLQLVEREPAQVSYLGFNRNVAPFVDEDVRQAVSLAIDKPRLIATSFPPGTKPAEQFLPGGIPGVSRSYDAQDHDYDPQEARNRLANAGYPFGFATTLSVPDRAGRHMPDPAAVASGIQAQLAEVGISVAVDVQSAATFAANVDAGALPFFLGGIEAGHADASAYYDPLFGVGAPARFGAGFGDVQSLLAAAASLSDQELRNDFYDDVATVLAERIPVVPLAHGTSAAAFGFAAEGADAGPLSTDDLAAVGIPAKDVFVWLQSREPQGLYCADETDAGSLRACAQVTESLLAHGKDGTEIVPSLADRYQANPALTEWVFSLRDGVVFHDESALDANDVVKSFQVQWDAGDPLHVGRTGAFIPFARLFGGLLPAQTPR